MPNKQHKIKSKIHKSKMFYSGLFRHLKFCQAGINTSGNLLKRFSTEFGNAEAIVYEQHGDPRKVLHKESNKPDTPLKPREVLIRMLAAPVNPADINMIQGTYGSLSDLPAVGGNEGVGQVISCGDEVSEFSGGDWVLPAPTATWGTWRTHVVANDNDLICIPNDIPMVPAATLKVNPSTAYRMLHDFVHLEPGDVLLQNGANSGVGQAVIQIADSMGVTTINIVRDREDFDVTEKHLKDLGAAQVVSTTFAQSRDMTELISNYPTPKLALNCVGGKVATAMMKFLCKGGTYVTYGGMSREPLTVPTSALIFRDIRFTGYWMTRWYKETASKQDVITMYTELIELIRRKYLLPPNCNLVPLSRYNEAIELALKSKTNSKQIIFMEQYDSD